MSKEILLITNYFPPEKGAAANRMHSIAEGLGEAGYSVKVVCPLPNYPNGKIFEGYSGKLSSTEEVSFGKITRLWIWPSNSANKILRLLSMFSFSFSLVLFFIFNKTPKKLFIQYSPVFVGFTAVCLGRVFSILPAGKARKIILNVSDIWPLAGLEMGILKEGSYYSLLQKMEAYCFRKVDLIVGQSEEILKHVSKFDLKKETFLYRNIPSFKIPKIEEKTNSKEIKIVYAGLLGMAQGILKIAESISLPKNVSFHIYGAGPEALKIKTLQKKKIYYHGELDRDSLHKSLQNYDIAFVPLVKRIYGSVPSKIFEYTRLGLPILYFAGGEGEIIVKTEAMGWVIPVNDLKALQTFIDTISEDKLRIFSKADIQKRSISAFNFKKQFKAFTTSIESV